MAELAPSKKYFTLSSVRLAHRAKDDTFHLTAQDEDFPDGFHMTLSSGSNLESRIRDLFEEHGLLKSFSGSAENLGQAYRDADALGAVKTSIEAGRAGEARAGEAVRLPRSEQDTRPRALVVGSGPVADALAGLRREWYFLPSVPDIESLWAGLANHTISDNIQYLLITDDFFDPKAGRVEAFENLVVTMAPYCFFGIVSYDGWKQKPILEGVGARALNSGLEGFAPYFFIDPQYPNKSIDAALNSYSVEDSEKALPRRATA